MTTENESVRAAGVTKMTTSILVGMCASPEFWINEGKMLGVPADQPSVVVLAAVALEQAETLIRVLIAAQQAREESVAAIVAAAKERTVAPMDSIEQPAFVPSVSISIIILTSLSLYLFIISTRVRSFVSSFSLL